MEKLWCVQFQNGEKKFVSCGSDRDYRRVWRLRSNGRYSVLPSHVIYPGCLKFMPYASIGEEVQLTQAEIASTFPGLPHPRWTDPVRANLIRDKDGNITFPTDPIEKAWAVVFEAVYYFESVTGDTSLLFDLLDKKRNWKKPEKSLGQHDGDGA